MKTVPSEDDVERCVSENFQKVFPLCLDFYIEGQRTIWTRWQEVVLAEFTWMIDDYWYSCGAIWNNYSKEVSKKLVLDIRWWLTCWKNFSGGGVNLPNFSHVGVKGVWLNVQREFRPGKRIFLRCFQNRWFSPFIGDEFSLIIRWHRQRSAPWQPGPRFQICPNCEDLPLRKGAPKGPAVSQTRFLARGSSDN